MRSVLSRVSEANDGKRCEVWATNLIYDLVNVYWPDLDACFPTFNRMGKVIKAKLRGSDVIFRDTLSFLPASVAALGEMVGLPKLPPDFESDEYCTRDAEITLKAACAVRDAMAQVGIEQIGATAGGTAWKHFSSRSKIPWDPEEWCEPAYYGGRVETYRHGMIEGPVYRWDVRSMYPSAMLDGPMPVPGTSVPGWREGHLASVEATVTVPLDSYIPPLPLRTPERLLYPVGTFRGQWMSVELEHAMECGLVVEKVHAARSWASETRPFDAWVRELWELRQQGGVCKLGAKILLNSLYGKFGQGTTRLACVKGSRLPYRWGDRYSWGLEEASDYPACTRFSWAALITARARIKLHKALLRAGESAIYCDTDSVFALTDVLADDCGDGLGEWEALETAKRIELLAPKVYRLETDTGWDYRSKGFPLACAEELFANGFITHRKPVSVREALRKDIRPNVWNEEIRVLNKGTGGRSKKGRLTAPPVQVHH